PAARPPAVRGRQHPRPGGGHLRADPDAVHHLRAAGPVRPLAHGQAVLRSLPALPQGDLQAAEGLPQDGASAMSVQPLLVADRLSVRFGGITAVDGVSFSVLPGEIFTIVGPNGAGKTTIFNLISRLYEPTSGRLFFNGRDITRIPPHRVATLGIARTFQNIELFEHATVLQNLLVGRHVHKRSNLFAELLFLPSVRHAERQHRLRVEEVIDLLDLQHYRDQLVASLPYGVRKLVELARALCTEPRLLLLDEPASGLNVEETE